MYTSCGCAHKPRPLLGYLAATSSATPAQVVATDPASTIVAQMCTAFSAKTGCQGGAGANKAGALQAFFAEAIATRLVPYPGTSQNAQMIMEADARTDCSSYAQSGADKAATITGGIAASVAKVDPEPISKAIASVIALVAGIFGANHAKAVAGEQADICSAVPAINGVLQQIDAGLANGSVTPSQAQSAYSSLQSQFSSALSKNTTYKQGDALWAYNQALIGVLQMRNQDLKNGVLTSGAPGPWTAAGKAAASALGSVTSALGLSPSETPWLILAGAAALAFLL